MINTKLFLLLGTSLSFIPTLSLAQCVATQDCATLGYTETSCNGGKGVKCPFGNKWACLGANEEECMKIACDKLDFKYSCSGTGYIGSIGQPCDGKYMMCQCADGYEWKDGGCTSVLSACDVGALYYNDGTCSNSKLSNKTLLGVVIYSDGSGGGWIITTEPIAENAAWSVYDTDIPELNNYTSTPDDIQDSCTNTDIIMARGSKSRFPAAWIAAEYKPSGMMVQYRWCLTSAGLLNFLTDKATYNKVNIGLKTAGGKEIGNQVFTPNEYMWTSSEYSRSHAWIFAPTPSGDYWVQSYDKPGKIYVRPVMKF